MDLPTDLRTLPTMPWSERPAELPLDPEECRTAIWLANGNVGAAAEILKVSSTRLRTFIRRSGYLSRELEETNAVLVDKARDVMMEALEDPDTSRKDSAAKFVLDKLGKKHGWGDNTKVSINSEGGNITFVWQDGGFEEERAGDVIDAEHRVVETTE